MFYKDSGNWNCFSSGAVFAACPPYQTVQRNRQWGARAVISNGDVINGYGPTLFQAIKALYANIRFMEALAVRDES